VVGQPSGPDARGGGAATAEPQGRQNGASSTPPTDDVGELDVGWAHGPVGHVLREAGRFVLARIMAFYTRRRVVGREQLKGLEPVVVFVANHGSHMDTPAILDALPRAWRRRTVVAAAADYFYANRALALLVSVLFNTVPIARRGASIAHIDRLLDRGHCLLLYPQGTRKRQDGVGRLRQGAAVLAARHGAWIVPIHIRGTQEAMPPGRRWPKRIGRGVRSRRHDVTITFGAPIAPPTDDRRAATERISRFFEAASSERH
jgi:1-acyl-sn-glycerol-3-phosphate acyltransferase